jgi:DNA repair exonuclease SbcCD ATPase subunit
MIIMAEKIRPIEQMLELSEEEGLAPEHLDSQVQKAQEQLLHLKRQQEQIEKQKRELEELSRRQEELERGRAEITDKLTRSLVVLEREAYDTQKRLEQIRTMRESFGQHLELIEAIDPKGWNPAELLQATGEKASDAALPEVGSDLSELNGGERSLFRWMQIGFALSLPFIIFGFIALFLFFWMATSGR